MCKPDDNLSNKISNILLKVTYIFDTKFIINTDELNVNTKTYNLFTVISTYYIYV